MNINKKQRDKIVKGMEHARERYQSVRGWYDKTDKDVTVICDGKQQKISMKKDGEDYRGYYPVGHLRRLLFYIVQDRCEYFSMEDIKTIVDKEAAKIAARALIEQVETEKDVLQILRELIIQEQSGVEVLRKGDGITLGCAGNNVYTIHMAFFGAGYEEWSVPVGRLIVEFYNKARNLQKGPKPIMEDLYCFECMKEMEAKGYAFVYFDVDKLLGEDSKAIYITKSKSPYTRMPKAYVKNYPLEFDKNDSFVNEESIKGKFELIDRHFTSKEMKRLVVGLNRLKKRYGGGGEAVFSLFNIMNEICRMSLNVYNITPLKISEMLKIKQDMNVLVDTVSIKDKMDKVLHEFKLAVSDGMLFEVEDSAGKEEDWPWDEAQDVYKEHEELLKFIKRDVEEMKKEEEAEEDNRLAGLFNEWLKDNGYTVIMESKHNVEKYAARVGKEKDIINITEELRMLGYRFNKYKKYYNVVEVN